MLVTTPEFDMALDQDNTNPSCDISCRIVFSVRLNLYNHGANEFARDGHCHINGIESFWSFTKRRLAKFNGVKVNFELHLKECEWRWKKEPETLSIELWEMLKNKTDC